MSINSGQQTSEYCRFVYSSYQNTLLLGHAKLISACNRYERYVIHQVSALFGLHTVTIINNKDFVIKEKRVYCSGGPGCCTPRTKLMPVPLEAILISRRKLEQKRIMIGKEVEWDKFTQECRSCPFEVNRSKQEIREKISQSISTDHESGLKQKIKNILR